MDQGLEAWLIRKSKSSERSSDASNSNDVVNLNETNQSANDESKFVLHIMFVLRIADLFIANSFINVPFTYYFENVCF